MVQSILRLIMMWAWGSSQHSVADPDATVGGCSGNHSSTGYGSSPPRSSPTPLTSWTYALLTVLLFTPAPSPVWVLAAPLQQGDRNSEAETLFEKYFGNYGGPGTDEVNMGCAVIPPTSGPTLHPYHLALRAMWGGSHAQHRGS
jgi:hypothetical protein